MTESIAARSARNGRSSLNQTIAVPRAAMAATSTHIAMSAPSSVSRDWSSSATVSAAAVSASSITEAASTLHRISVLRAPIGSPVPSVAPEGEIAGKAKYSVRRMTITATTASTATALTASPLS